jgi:DNA-binding transcriptional LysR family regulator
MASIMDWYLIRYFLAVAETGNFSRAAVRMNVTQPTLSAGIAKLEGQLGKRLFDRDKRRVSLTEAGSRFLTHAKRLSRDYETALADLTHTGRRKILRVGILSTIPTGLVETAVVHHVRHLAACNVEMIDGSDRELKSRLEEGRIDVALTIPGAAAAAPIQKSASTCSAAPRRVTKAHARTGLTFAARSLRTSSSKA